MSLTKPNLALSQSRVWHNNLYLPLLDLGHEVIEYDIDLESFLFEEDDVSIRRNKFEGALLEAIKAAHREKSIDLFFSYFYDVMCSPDVIREIRSMGIVTVNWYCNASYQLDLVEKISPAYDWCWVPEKFRLDDYRKLGANPLYVQEAANPNIYKPYPLKRIYDVAFIGQSYGNRRDYINKLYSEGRFDIHAWGPGWEQCDLSKWRQPLSRGKGLLREITGNRLPWLPWYRSHAPLSDDEMVKMFSRCKINLGFSVCGNTHMDEQPILQIRLRDFEAPMSGAFYITEYFQELTEYFEPDKEIVMYHSFADLIDKCKYYLHHEAERERIRLAGMKRALAEHTWHKRYQDAFKQMGVDGK